MVRNYQGTWVDVFLLIIQRSSDSPSMLKTNTFLMKVALLFLLIFNLNILILVL